MAKRLLFETDKRLLWKLAWNMGPGGMLSVAIDAHGGGPRRRFVGHGPISEGNP